MKYISHYLSVFILSMAFSLSGQDVEISIDHPDMVKAGENFEVTVTIKKGSLTDYSRFSQNIPLGLTATNVSSPNADFSFDEQRVRIIWLKLPEASEIAVTYLVSVDARLKGTFSLGGVFAYVVADERKFLNFDEDQQKPITIVPSNTIDPALIVNIGDFRGGAAPVVQAPVSTGGGPFAMAIRQKPELLNSGGYRIHLLIDNPRGSKYAKVEESIPSGYLFEKVNSNGGIESHAASTVKFIWMKMPEQSEFEVIYRLVPKQNEPQGNMLIEGLLTYTDGNENREAAIVEMDVSLDDMGATQKRDLLATGKVPQTTRPTETVTAETKPPVTRPPANNPDMGGASGRTIVNTKVLDRGTGIYFRVQLTANMNAFDATTFYRDAGVEREVFVEQHNGYYKYTIGPFQTYSQALSYKEQVERLQAVDGPFVVGYNNGNRVSAGSLR